MPCVPALQLVGFDVQVRRFVVRSSHRNLSPVVHRRLQQLAPHTSSITGCEALVLAAKPLAFVSPGAAFQQSVRSCCAIRRCLWQSAVQPFGCAGFAVKLSGFVAQSLAAPISYTHEVACGQENHIPFRTRWSGLLHRCGASLPGLQSAAGCLRLQASADT